MTTSGGEAPSAADGASSTDPEALGLEARASEADHRSLRLWLRLLACSTEIEAEIRRRLRAGFDMGLARFDYLAQLHRHPDGLRMSALSRYLMVTGGNVTGLTDELQAEGLVLRSAAPDDRRATRVRLTPAGRRAFERVAAVHEGWVVELFAGLDDAERETLHHLLGRLRSRPAGEGPATGPSSPTDAPSPAEPSPAPPPSPRSRPGRAPRSAR